MMSSSGMVCQKVRYGVDSGGKSNVERSLVQLIQQIGIRTAVQQETHKPDGSPSLCRKMQARSVQVIGVACVRIGP